MRIRRAEPYGINGYYIPVTGLDVRNSEQFPWGSYKDVGLVNRFKEIQTRGEELAERSLEVIEKEVLERFGDGDYIYALPRNRKSSRVIVMRLLEKKVE